MQKHSALSAIASPGSAGKTVDSPWRAHRAREPQRSDKKDAVLLAGARLFTRKGFQGTSLDDIAQSLGVTKPTLYYYIANKEEILIECVERGLSTFHQGLGDLVQSGLGGRGLLRAAMALYAEVVTSDFGMCASRVGEDPLSEEKRRVLRQRKAEVDVDFRVLIEQGMQRGWIVEGDASVAAFTVVGALSGIGRWYRPETHSPQSLQYAVQHCIEMLLRGVLSAPTVPFSDSPQGPAAMTALRRENHFENRLVLCYSQRPTHVAEMLAAALAARPDGLAVVCGDMRLSWRELHHAATKCAGGLAQRGVQSGDRVALHMGNGPEFIILTLACAWMGAVLVPVSARARGMELEYVLSDSGAVALVCAPDVAHWQPAPHSLPELRMRFVTGGAAVEGFEAFSALMQVAPQPQPHAAQEEDLAVLLYTSGTTGRPKGAMITQLNIVHSVMHYAERMALSERDISLVAVPMSHVTGLVAQLYTMLFCQGTTVVMAQFKAVEFVRLASAERITHAIMVPAMYNLCLLLPDLQAHDMSAWRIGAYGGASMPTATIDGLAQRLPGLVLMNAYGATETCSPATIMPQGQTDSHRDSVGLPVPCGEICIMDDAGFEVARGGVGEIWIAGPMVVPGYWRNAAATASEFKAGFWRSGDIGSMDAQGFVRVLDRKKDVINRGGYKVYCAQVENVLSEHPAVLEVALVGVPCAVLGERVHAFVSVREISEHSKAPALQAYCSQRMADYAVPETWTIDTEPLPRNLNGKIVKRELRQTLHAALI
jgi:acyl-CoA synthetase (AMP-forming)/AMP-acid ligase II/AcrR family transcriptional regulator